MDFLGLQGAAPLPMSADPAALAERARQPDARSVDAVASGFESLFVSMLVKEMRQSLDSDTLFSGDSSDIMGGLFDMTLGQHLSKSGALGIGALVKQQLSQREHGHDSRPTSS